MCPIPPTFYCVGLNYAEHILMEAKLRGVEPALSGKPDVGYRARSALIGHRAPIVLPPDATPQVEYEGELACVIGRPAKHLTRDDALACLLGFTIGNDVRERSWQAEDRTLWRAKDTDTFKPMGPWIEADFDLDAAMTRVRVNDRQVIEFPTNRMISGSPRALPDDRTKHAGDAARVAASHRSRRRHLHSFLRQRRCGGVHQRRADRATRFSANG